MKLLPGFLLLFLLGILENRAAAQSTNTTVRFRFSYGSHFFASVDVELLDQDKPATVSNFLSYVERGDYDNSILHEHMPGVALRGGRMKVANPFSSALIQKFSRIPDAAPVENEFFQGTIQSNIFGTLALALPGGTNSDSATCEWFFNLADNSNGTGSTNFNEGGYTVFGRVTAGRDVLRFFNTLTDGAGIQNFGGPLQQSSCFPVSILTNNADTGTDFTGALPVGFYGAACVRYNDLFNVQILVLDGSNLRRPSVAIVAPAPFGSFTESSLTVTGTATDDEAVTSVRVYLNTGQPLLAAGTNEWAITLDNIPPGTNILVAESIDTDGLRSQITRSIFHSVASPLILGTNGSGTTSGLTNGQPLEIGRGYQITAIPDPGHLFAGWTGSAASGNTALNFIARSNTTLTATFATNLFPQVKGTYSGLFMSPNPVQQRSSGLLNLTLGDFGSYSAWLSMNGRSYRFAGTFAVDGKETNVGKETKVVARLGMNSLLIQLSINFTNGSDPLVGGIGELDGAGRLLWAAAVRADRPAFDAIENPAPQAGRYTMLIPSDATSTSGPWGDSIGLVAVTPHGAVTFQGLLADGTKATQKATLSKNGEWPLYLPLYGDKGAMIGSIRFTNEIASDMTGRVHWFKQGHSARYHAKGFTNQSFVLGSTYHPAVAPNSILDLTNATLSFTNGNLIANFANDVIFANNRVQNLSPGKLTLNVSAASGLFTGSVRPLWNNRTVSFTGVALQKQNFGSGFFLGTNQGGSLLFQGD